MSADHDDPLQPHAHEPNPEPPSRDATFTLWLSSGKRQTITPALLRALPRTEVAGVTIVSTGHGSSGPFRFGGVALRDFIQAFREETGGFRCLEVISEDGFGTRIGAKELEDESPGEQVLLADMIDGQPLSRNEGLVRLIVPSEVDDALRQVKWVGKIVVRA